jgi:hypothetical protein
VPYRLGFESLTKQKTSLDASCMDTLYVSISMTEHAAADPAALQPAAGLLRLRQLVQLLIRHHGIRHIFIAQAPQQQQLQQVGVLTDTADSQGLYHVLAGDS